MKVIQINTFSYKAAGNIMMNIHHELIKKGVDSYVAWGRGRNSQNNHEYFMNDEIGVRAHGVYTRLTDRTGFLSKNSTKRLLRWIDTIKPDIIHLHCIHGYYINIEMLFDYIRNNNIRVIWTQHDCWSFTGHCAYFDSVGCDKWENGCYNCEQLRTYPASYNDNSKENWLKKRKLFSNLDITIVVPCNWLKKIIKKSFLNNYETKVIFNGISIEKFKPTLKKFKEQNKLNHYCIILGVASEWTERKGLKDFIKLNEMLDHSLYKIVLVGLTDRQLKKMPNDIIALKRTESIEELADIYSSADFFYNPTYEDNFPTTNLESLACGTPVLTYNTGGSPESLDERNGFVAFKGDVEAIYKYIKDNNKKLVKKEALLNTSKFTVEAMLNKYWEIYNEKNYIQ